MYHILSTMALTGLEGDSWIEQEGNRLIYSKGLESFFIGIEQLTITGSLSCISSWEIIWPIIATNLSSYARALSWNYFLWLQSQSSRLPYLENILRLRYFPIIHKQISIRKRKTFKSFNNKFSFYRCMMKV